MKWGIPFLDTLVTPEADNSLSFTVYCMPIHTDQYLQWDSHHNLSAKYSVIGTLTHRAKTVCTKPVLLQKELSHLKEALVKCKYPPWAISRVQNKFINNNQGENGDINNIQAIITMQVSNNQKHQWKPYITGPKHGPGSYHSKQGLTRPKQQHCKYWNHFTYSTQI